MDDLKPFGEEVMAVPEPSAPPTRPSEERARDQVAALLAWAAAELAFDESDLRSCSAELVDAGRRAQGVTSLAAAHEELLLRAGGDAPGSALTRIFGSDAVGIDAMIGGPGLAPMRARALEVVSRAGYDLDEFDVVIRVGQGHEVEYVVTGSPDPPVWAFLDGAADPVLRHPSFTDWLQYRVRRSVKHTFPLRTVRFGGPAGSPDR